MALRYGNLKIANTNGEIFPNSISGDMMLYTETAQQQLQLGTGIGSRSMVTINSNNTQFAGSVVPASNAMYDLGSSTSRFRDAFLSNVNLSGSILQADGTPFVSGTPGLSNNGSNAVYVLSGSNLGVGTSNPSALLDVAGNAFVRSQFLGNSNASNLPSYSWSNDPTSGMYSQSNSVIGFSCGGSQVAALNTSGMSILGNIRMGDSTGVFNTSGTMVNGGGVADGTITAAKLAPSIEAWLVQSSNASYIGMTSNQFYGIGKSNPAYKLDVVGEIYATGNIIAFSDERYKTNVHVIENALEKTLAIKGYTYTKLDDDKRYAGVMAQEVQKVLPEVVETDPEGKLSVAYGNISALLIQAIHELTKRVEALESR